MDKIKRSSIIDRAKNEVNGFSTMFSLLEQIIKLPSLKREKKLQASILIAIGIARWAD